MIPSVDISAFTTSQRDITVREAMAKELAEKCQINGCVGITGHGVPSELLREAFDVSKRFFDLPME